MSDSVISVACFDVDMSLGLGVYLHRRIFLGDFDPMKIPNVLLDASMRACIAIVRQKRMILETVDSDKSELIARLYITDPPEPLEHLIIPVRVQNTNCAGISVGAVLQYFLERKFPKNDILAMFR